MEGPFFPYEMQEQAEEAALRAHEQALDDPTWGLTDGQVAQMFEPEEEQTEPEEEPPW